MKVLAERCGLVGVKMVASGGRGFMWWGSNHEFDWMAVVNRQRFNGVKVTKKVKAALPKAPVWLNAKVESIRLSGSLTNVQKLQALALLQGKAVRAAAEKLGADQKNPGDFFKVVGLLTEKGEKGAVEAYEQGQVANGKAASVPLKASKILPTTKRGLARLGSI